MTAKYKPWPKSREADQCDIPPPRVEEDLLRVCYVGHSTLLIQTQGLNILTDPIWSNRASPFKNFGPERHSVPGIHFKDLPPIDIVLISHNHYDHLDIPTIKQIWEKDHPAIIAPLGNDKVIQLKLPSIKVETLDWNQSFKVRHTLLHLTPSQHWSARNLFDRNKALWGAFVISTPADNIYFCGDSGYGNGEVFRQTLKNFGSFRLAMLPIGSYEPSWFMRYAHMSPEEAVLAFKDLGQPYTVATHYEIFKLGDEGFNEPTDLLSQALKKHEAGQQQFRCLKAGEVWWIPKL